MNADEKTVDIYHLFISLCENLYSSAFQLIIAWHTSPCGKHSKLEVNEWLDLATLHLNNQINHSHH